MLIPKPETLLVLQAFIVASGAIPLMLICKNHKLTTAASCAFAAIFTLYPCFTGGCFTYIHENNFLAPLVLWLVYFCEKGKTVPMLIFTVLLLGVKEDAAVYAAVIAIYFLFASKNYKCNLFMLILSIVWFIFVTNHLSKQGAGVMTYRYGKYIYDGSGSLLIYLSVVNYSELKKPKLLLCSLCCSVIVFFGLYYHRIEYKKDFKKAQAQREIIDSALAMIPSDASVISTAFLLPNLSQRKVIYELEYTKQQAEYYVLDLRYDTDEYSVSDYMTPDFTVPFYEEGVIAVFKREKQE